MEMQKQPLLTHLEELLRRTRRILFWAFIGCSIAYFYTDELLLLIWEPASAHLNMGTNLVFTKPFEKVWVLIRLSFIGGIVLMSPFIAYEVISFVKPALTAKEKMRSYVLLLSFSIFFIVGLLFGYHYSIPFIIKAVVGFGGVEVPALFSLSSYVNTALGILLLSALFFEIPVVMVHLTSWGWVSADFWARSRKISIVVNSIVSAFLSPPDPLSMILMMIPLQILYEAGIQISRMAKWNREDT